MNDETSEEELTVQQSFDLAWGKFVPWATTQARNCLPGQLATFVESNISRPSSFALLTANSMLRERRPEEPDREEVENRRKIVRTRDIAEIRRTVMTLFELESWPFPREAEEKFWRYAEVFLDLIDAMNETLQ